MAVFWKLSGFWVNTEHIIAVRELRARADGPSKFKVILDGTMGELPGEIVCEGDEAIKLVQLLERSGPDSSPRGPEPKSTRTP